jgi:hypothetical protein
MDCATSSTPTRACRANPRHVHVKGGGRDAKIWLEPEVAIGDSSGFNSRELSHILGVVTQNRERLLRAWNDHFGDNRPL